MQFADMFGPLHEQATAACGLDDFGPADYQEPLRRMLADLDAYSTFTPEGVTMIAQELAGKLVGRLLAVAGFKAHPEVETARIERPIFIIGMARSGTTALHKLLTRSPDTQGLELWLGSVPMPRPPRETWDANPAYQQVRAGLEALFAFHPFILQVHPMSADLPDECRFGLDQTFWSPGLMSTTCVPDYMHWMVKTDATPAYEHYRRLLALVGRGDNRQWVLKDPSHLFGIDSLLKVFPDACIVQTHRALDRSVASTASGIWPLRHGREPGLTKLEIGQQTAEMWTLGLEKMERVRASLPAGQVFDVHVDQFSADPAGVAERIFTHFGLPITEASRAAWAAHAARDPRAGHGKHDFSAAEFGLDDAALRAAAPAYSRRLDAVTAAAAA